MNKLIKKAPPFSFNLVLLVAALVINVAIGAIFIAPSTLIQILLAKLPAMNIAADWPAHFETIILSIRLPHAILIMMTGAALASSGAAYQGLFRNPLADPYLIGVASGA
ncbi:MAG: iron chelate uptake ABC transporter family permease subunit, partial [Anaerolineales bacterium]